MVSKLDLGEASKLVTKTPLTSLPRLISDRALEAAQGDLAKQTGAELKTGLVPSVEFIPMPKHGFGNRPLAILSPQTRVVLEALAVRLGESLPISSREQTDFQSFESFGTETPSAWLVDFDIAACYEFIDHNVLASELILQGADADAVGITRATLSALFGRHIGLPQGVASSHRFSDAYLDVIERSLTRHGYEVKRYADDFRVVANSRKEAFHVIETAMEEARRVHLALAEQKIHVRKASEVDQALQTRSGLIDEYTRKVYGDLTKQVMIPRGYEDWDIEVTEPNQAEVDFEAMKQLLSDWGNPDEKRSTPMAYAGSVALSKAGQLQDRIPNTILARIVEKEPVRLQKVMKYLLSREDSADNWKLLQQISGQERSTPWHKIWLLSTASVLPDSDSAEKNLFLEFVSAQLSDNYETVRLEAAWVLAKNGLLSSAELQNLYSIATKVSQVGLAAVAGLVSQTKGQQGDKAVQGDSALNRCAFKWGESFGPNL